MKRKYIILGLAIASIGTGFMARMYIHPPTLRPGSGQEKLGRQNASGELSVPAQTQPLYAFGNSQWVKADYTFGANKGELNKNNVSQNHNTLLLMSPANTYDGAGIESVGRYSFGLFSSRIQCPKLLGAICTFFLYEDTPDKKANEIDMEIYTDGSRKIDLVVHVKGLRKYYTQLILPFDPSEDFHEYLIDYQESQINFYADSKFLARFENDIGQSAMKIVSNLWWPEWMPLSSKAPEDRFMQIGLIQYESSNLISR